MNNNLLIIGAGDYGQIAYEIAESMERFDKIDFLDDNSDLAIGKIREIEKYYANDYSFGIVAMGDPESRYMLTRTLKENCFHVPVLIHPKAHVGKYASLKMGCIVEPMAVVHSGANVGPCTLISSGAVVNHSTLIEGYCHVDIGGLVSARSVMPRFTKVNPGEVYSAMKFQIQPESKKASDQDFIREYIKMYGREPNLFDGV
ncbi:MAG: PglB [Blautia sp.]|nr:PglB [Blautia sp.]